jgi:hypothetical protein
MPASKMPISNKFSWKSIFLFLYLK